MVAPTTIDPRAASAAAAATTTKKRMSGNDHHTRPKKKKKERKQRKKERKQKKDDDRDNNSIEDDGASNIKATGVVVVVGEERASSLNSLSRSTTGGGGDRGSPSKEETREEEQRQRRDNRTEEEKLNKKKTKKKKRKRRRHCVDGEEEEVDKEEKRRQQQRKEEGRCTDDDDDAKKKDPSEGGKDVVRKQSPLSKRLKLEVAASSNGGNNSNFDGDTTDGVAPSPVKNGNRTAVHRTSCTRTTGRRPIHPFRTDESDHCETPLNAYRDILPFLSHVASTLNKPPSALRIYDPYYCDGSVVRKLVSLGYPNVRNVNRDFYKDVKEGQIQPTDYDVILTNPPYSGKHLERILEYVAYGTIDGRKGGERTRTASINQQKPYLLLLPHFVYTKEYYGRIFNHSTSTTSQFFLVPSPPSKRYAYVPPTWASSTDGGSTSISKGKTSTAPFPSFWYCSFGSGSSSGKKREEEERRWLEQMYGFVRGGGARGGGGKKNCSSIGVRCALRPADLPYELRGEFDRNKKRPNPRARKRMAARKRREQAQAASGR